MVCIYLLLSLLSQSHVRNNFEMVIEVFSFLLTNSDITVVKSGGFGGTTRVSVTRIRLGSVLQRVAGTNKSCFGRTQYDEAFTEFRKDGES